MNIVLLGAPGSGKGTQAERLGAHLGLVHVASGDLFRDKLNRETELGLLARKYMNRGELVPDEITVEMLRQRLQQPDVRPGVLLDGFPRTEPQATALDAMLKDFEQGVDGVLYIEVPDEELVSRLSGRLICRECQTPFHKIFNPFKTCPETRCDGEYLYQREDDKPETVRARLKTYHSQTAPLIKHYKSSGILVRVDGVGSLEEVTEGCLQAAHRIGQLR
jgi:adenylate kinase